MLTRITEMDGWSSAWAPRLPEVTKLLGSQQMIGSASDSRAAEDFRDAMAAWISCGPSLDWSGCEHKSMWAMCNGIHDALVQQISYRSPKVARFVTFRDDYRYYSTLLSGKSHVELYWNDIGRIERGDYVIVSWPNHHGILDNGLAELVERCSKVGAGIFLDCAFYGTVGNGIVDTSDPVFDAVAFSVSKAFQLGGLRAGMVWGNDLAPSLTVPMRSEYSVYNAASAVAAAAVLRQFPADTLPRICYPLQESWCTDHGFDPADVCFFALGRSSDYAGMYRKGGDYIRICISEHLQASLPALNT